MITYVNSKDAKLFELAAADLGMESLDLDQYLNNLAKLKAISPKYVRLPLYEDNHKDEEIFEIDANARTIKIPTSFSRNGIGVVSDELAETVWFKINRYFDIKDFGKAAGHEESDELKDGDLHILIQWEAPDGTKGASWAYAIDKDTDPEYIYFGWAITAEHLTAKAGNIRFAIRIMQYDANKKVSYSFATQAAAVAVKSNLDFDLTDENVIIENVTDKIASRLMGGQIAYCPVFAENGNLPPYILNLAIPDGAPEGTTPRAKLEVVAKAPEGNSYDAIAYKWYKKGSNDNEFSQIEGEYKPALTVTSSGKYYVVVFGMIKIVDNEEFIYDSATDTATKGEFKYHTSVASSQSIVCEVPAPIALEILEDLSPSLVLGEDASLALVVERQKIGEDVVGDVTLKIEKTANAVKDIDLEIAEFNEVTGIPYTVNGNNIVINMSNAAEGYYKITVINKLNGDTEETTSTIICRVVKPAEVNNAVATLLTEGGNPSDATEGSVSRGNKIKADITINGLSDDLIIQWYKVVDEQDPNPEGAAEDDILIEGANETIYIPDDDGFFYFVATNVVEGTEALKRSNIIKFAL